MKLPHLVKNKVKELKIECVFANPQINPRLLGSIFNDVNLEISTRYLIFNDNEFNCHKFIFKEHLVIDQLLNKSTEQFQLN